MPLMDRTVERWQESIGKRDGNQTLVAVSTTELYVGALTTWQSAPTQIHILQNQICSGFILVHNSYFSWLNQE